MRFYNLGREVSKQLSFSNNLIKIVTNLGWLFIQRVLNIGLALTVGILIMRHLGPNDFGRLSYIVSFFGILIVVAKLGLDGIVVRDLVKKPESESELLGTVFILRFIMAGIGVLCVNVWIYFIDTVDIQTRLIFLVIGVSAIFTSADVVVFWYRAKVLSKYTAIFTIVATIIGGGLRLLLVYSNATVTAFAFVMFFEVLFYTVGPSILYYQFFKGKGRWRYIPDVSRQVLKESFPLALSTIFVATYFKVDQVMLAYLSTNETVGIYAAAVKFSEVWYFLPLIITQSIFPSFVALKQSGDRDVYLKRMQIQNNLMVQISFLIAVLMTFISDPLLDLLLGDQYSGAGLILSVHIWSGIFVFLEASRIRWFLLEDLTKYQPLTTIFGAILNIAMNYLLIPRFQGLGCAIATLTSYALAVYFSCFLYPELREITRQMTKALLSPLNLRSYIEALSFMYKLISVREEVENEIRFDTK